MSSFWRLGERAEVVLGHPSFTQLVLGYPFRFFSPPAPLVHARALLCFSYAQFQVFLDLTLQTPLGHTENTHHFSRVMQEVGRYFRWSQVLLA